MRRRATAGIALVVLGLAGLADCADAPIVLPPGTAMQLTLSGVRPLDPETEGSLTLWGEDATGTVVWSEHIDVPAGGEGEGGDASAARRVLFTLGAGIVRFKVTIEPPGDADDVPSPSVLLAGDLRNGSARLAIEGSVTDGRPLERDPGHHSLFTSSNNVELGYPSYENAGLWLFSISARVNKHNSREVKLTPLTRGWIYEGWIVREPGTSRELWIPYGKFRPDELGLLTSRDNTGSGLFSGDADFRNGGVEDAPGDEWTTTRVADELGVALPAGLTLPLALDAVDPNTGQALWYHVITIEPVRDEDEPLMTDRPFLLQPYRNPVGAGGPGVPRLIEFQANEPTGTIAAVR